MTFWRTALVVAITAVTVIVLPGLLKPRLPKVVSGYTAKGWERVAEVFRRHVDEGIERGGAFAVYHKGELVVEYSGGYADEQAEWPWNKDTINNFFSSVKGVSGIIAAMLVDRGHLEYDKPVATYWPEFAQNGKEDITVRQILSQTAGLAWYDEPTTIWDMVDNPKKISDALAKQKPHWEPGTEHGYHALTIGMYIDQIVRRADPKHRDLSQFFREEVAQPHGIDFFIGLPPEQNYRCARVYTTDGEGILSTLDQPKLTAMKLFIVILGLFKELEITKALNSPAGFSFTRHNDPRVRAIPCGSSRGYGTAIGMAKLYGLVAMGKLISQPVLQDMVTPRAGPGPDRLIFANATYATGFSLMDFRKGATMFGYPGAGGQYAAGDLKNQLGLAYSTNFHQMIAPQDDVRMTELVDTVYEVLNANR